MKPLKDYSFVRGVCHNPALGLPQKDLEEKLERELGFCLKLNINSIRFWLVQEEYDKDPRGYLAVIETFIRMCGERDITVMPILWNGNFITDFKEPDEAWYEKARLYAKDVIDRFRDEPHLLMWDVINEPLCNDYMNHCPGEEYGERFAKIRTYIRRLFAIVKDLDGENCLTVGHEQVRHCLSTDDLVDVISYHDYLGTRKLIEGAILEAEALGRKWNKPILNTETGCVGWANPYEIELELAQKHRVGWYLFLLVSEGFWGGHTRPYLPGRNHPGSRGHSRPVRVLPQPGGGPDPGERQQGGPCGPGDQDGGGRPPGGTDHPVHVKGQNHRGHS